MAQVDIVMPLYNKAPFVARAIESIRAQSLQDWRLIVVDDGSQDDGANVVRRFDDTRIELLQQLNQGPGPARNAGIRRVTSEFVAFLDADDQWYPWYLANALQALRQNQDVSLVGSLYYRWPSGEDATAFLARLGVRPGKYSIDAAEDPLRIIRFINFLLPWNTVFRTEVIRNYGCFQECNFGPGPEYEFGEDVTLNLRLIMAETFMVIGPPAARYHTECSQIGGIRRPEPLEVFLARPEVVTNYCPPEKQQLLLKVLDRAAVWRAYHWAYHGCRKEAKQIINRYPGGRAFRRQYCSYLYYCYIRPRFWTRFKCAVGPPVRRACRAMAVRIGLLPNHHTAPPMKENATHDGDPS